MSEEASAERLAAVAARLESISERLADDGCGDDEASELVAEAAELSAEALTVAREAMRSASVADD